MVSETVISGIQLLAPGIAHARAYHPFQTPKLGVRSPESAQGEGGGIKVTRCGDVDRGDGHFVFSRQTHGTLPVMYFFNCHIIGKDSYNTIKGPLERVLQIGGEFWNKTPKTKPRFDRLVLLY